MLVIAADPSSPASANSSARWRLRHAVPAIYPYRGFALAGGLMSYGVSKTDTYRRPAFTRVASSRARSRPTCR